jgi:hypothetical protein
MTRMVSDLIDNLSEFFAHRKGLLPVLGILLVIANFILRQLSLGWFSTSDVALHLGIIVSIIGFMLAWAL